jgi:hypothetical protein
MQPPAGPLIQTAPLGVASSVSHLLLHTCKSKIISKVINMKHNIIMETKPLTRELKTEQCYNQGSWLCVTLRYFKPVYIIITYFPKIYFNIIIQPHYLSSRRVFQVVPLMKIPHTHNLSHLMYMSCLLWHSWLDWKTRIYPEVPYYQVCNMLSSSVCYFTTIGLILPVYITPSERDHIL